MTTSDNETVAVSVDLINTYLGSSDAERWPQMANALRALIPKPKPRLVAVEDNGTNIGAGYLSTLPDLLTVLDSVLDDEVMSPELRASIRHAFRAALGATK